MTTEKSIHPLALELAEILDDMDSLQLYQGFTEQFSEVLLRDTLKKVLSIPKEKIRKNRAALYNYLMQRHVQKSRGYGGY